MFAGSAAGAVLRKNVWRSNAKGILFLLALTIEALENNSAALVPIFSAMPLQFEAVPFEHVQ